MKLEDIHENDLVKEYFMMWKILMTHYKVKKQVTKQ